MKYIYCIAILLLCLNFNGQAQGLKFTHNLDQALKSAKAENKLVFVDFYTSWCGPCKRLTKDVFPTKIAGEFFNANFINCKIQCDDKGVGAELGKKYGISAYPTLMFINENGQIVHSMAGAPDVNGLIEFAKVALDPENNLLSITKKWDDGNRESNFVKDYFKCLSDAFLKQKMKKDFEHYFNSLCTDEKNTKFTFELIKLVGATPFMSIFEYVEANKEAYYKSVSKSEIDFFIANTYLWYLKYMANGSDRQEYSIAMSKFKLKGYSFYNEYAQFTSIFASCDENGNYDLIDYQKRGTEFLSKYGKNNVAYAISLTNLLGNLTGRPNEGTAGIKWMEDLLEWNQDPRIYNSYLYIVRRNYQFDKALKIAQGMRENALTIGTSTKQIDTKIEEIKAYQVKYNKNREN